MWTIKVTFITEHDTLKSEHCEPALRLEDCANAMKGILVKHWLKHDILIVNSMGQS